MKEHIDRLVDTLLREEVGGEAPPNLGPGILAREAQRRRMQKITWGSWIAAAVISMTLGAWWIAAQRYPPPTLTGIELPSDQPLMRGITLTTGKESAVLTLGGYCSVKIAPESEIQWTGEPKAEEIILNSGIVECDVNPDHGRFQVRSNAGVAAAVGTHYAAKIVDRKGRGPDAPKKMYVKVTSGIVLVTGTWGSVTLSGGEDALVPPPHIKPAPPASAPPPPQTATTTVGVVRAPTTTVRPPPEKEPDIKEGRIVGILVTRPTDHIYVKAEGQHEPRRYFPVWGPDGLDRKMLETIRRMPSGNLVEVNWKWDEHYRVIGIQMYVPPEKEGVVEGTVMGKGERWVDIKPDGRSFTERYTARWTENPEPSAEPDPVQVISELKRGDRVKVAWHYGERKTITGFLRASPAPRLTVPAP